MKKRLLALALTLVMALALAACANKADPAPEGGEPEGGEPADTTITIGASPAPHAEILEVVAPLLEAEGYTLDIQEFDDYIIPNTAVEEGQLDANFFQHITYMNSFNESDGTHLYSVAEVHYEPFAIYAGKTTALADLPEGAQIAIPNDATNGGRALLLLAENGIITLKEDAGLEPTEADIVENAKNVKIVATEARLLPTVLQDVDVAVINGNYAIGAGLKVADALAVEDPDGIAGTAYVNVVAVKEGAENKEKIKALVAALQSDEVKTFMEETYEGAVVPVF